MAGPSMHNAVDTEPAETVSMGVTRTSDPLNGGGSTLRSTTAGGPEDRAGLDGSADLPDVPAPGGHPPGGPGEVPERRLRSAPPRAVLIFIQVAAVAAMLVMREFQVIASLDIWVYPTVIFCAAGGSLLLDHWYIASRGGWRYHVVVGVHAFIVMAVTYVTGWGPALVMWFAFAGIVDITTLGSRAWRAAFGWSLVASTVGQALLLLGWMPSSLPVSNANVLWVLGTFTFAVLIALTGAAARRREEVELSLRHSRESERRGEARYRFIVDGASDAILLLDGLGTIQSVNSAGCSIFGRTEAELHGLNPATMVAGLPQDTFVEVLEAARSTGTGGGEFIRSELSVVHPNGELTPILLSARVLRGKGAEPFISLVARDLTEQKRLEAELVRQAAHDPLTGLLNRLTLTGQVESAIARAGRSGQGCAVLVLDLDGFKAVNDSHGHAVGDKLLVQVAQRIQSVVRQTDTVARPGGDEFVVLCEPVGGTAEATDVAERVLAAISVPYELGDVEARVSGSIGIFVSHTGVEGAETMLANADAAMYEAKRSGRGQIRSFNEPSRFHEHALGAAGPG